MIKRQLVATILVGFAVALAMPVSAWADTHAALKGHPRLLLSKADASQMSAAATQAPVFNKALIKAKKTVAPLLESMPDVPVPKDAGGGYTHEQHKRNSKVIQDAGVLYQVTGEQAYADLVKDMLLAYAELFPTLGEHPEKKEQSPGRLFWQSLNEAVWLLTVIQGYDSAFDGISEADKSTIENKLFHPMVSFLSDESPQTFNKVHNHGTWANAAVGMTGYVLDKPEYVEKALYGLEQDGNAGFMKQLDELFSPDGYYNEGPYYQRYALMPFLLFAKSIDENEPQRKIFEYRDGILLKAIYASIQLSYGGYFFPINDALKDKGLDTIELCYGVAIAYGQTQDASLLSIAKDQGRVVLTGQGYHLAAAMHSVKAEPFDYKSMSMRDGPKGDRGALIILRSVKDADQQALVLKSTSQGMGHGHYDRLSWLFYDNGREIISDYGAARFLNVESKNGGHYLRENNSWAKQTVAHNTLVVDESSQFRGDWEYAEAFHPDVLAFSSGQRADGSGVELGAAQVEDAYEGVTFSRSMSLLTSDNYAYPLVVDVLNVSSDAKHQYDLPLYFHGHITNSSHALEASTKVMKPVGEKNGYQHLWLRAKTEVRKGELFQLTFLNHNRFYTYSVLAEQDLDILFTELGANDPDFNLRREQGLIVRARNSADSTFVSVLEPHGEYNGSREFTTVSRSTLASIAVTGKGESTRISLTNAQGESDKLNAFDPIEE